MGQSPRLILPFSFSAIENQISIDDALASGELRSHKGIGLQKPPAQTTGIQPIQKNRSQSPSKLLTPAER